MYVCMYVCVYVCMYRTWAIQHPYFKYYLLIFTNDIRLCILSVWHRNPTFLFQCHSQSQQPYFKIQYSTSLIQHCVLTIQQIYLYYYSHATFVCVFYLNFCSIECLVCVLWCRVRYACSAMQHSCLDIEFSLSGLAPSVSRVSRSLRLTSGVR